MKLLADENIPSSVVRALVDGGYDIVWIRTEAPGISDLEVMRYAYQEKRILLTYDKDFGELAVKDNLCPTAGIILFRLSLKNPASITHPTLSRCNSSPYIQCGSVFEIFYWQYTSGTRD